MAEELRLNIVSTADSKGFDKAVKDMSDAKAEAGKLSDEFAKAGQNAEDLDQSVGDATKSIKTHSEQVRVLRAEYEKTTKRIAELDAQLLGGGDSKAIKKDLREQRAWLAEIQKVAREVQRTSGISFKLGNDDSPVTTGVLEGLLNGLPKLGGMDSRLIAGGAAAGLALAPPIAAAVSGAILGAVGVGGVIGGAVLAARDPQVKAAWKQVGSTLMHELEPAGKAFTGPVTQAAFTLQNSFAKSGIADALAGAAGLTDPLARGLGGFVEKLGPGIDRALQGARPIADMLEKKLPEFGNDLSESLSTVAAVAPGAARGLGQVVTVTGELTKQAAAAGAGLTALNNLFPTTIGLIRLVPIGGFVQVIGTAAEQTAPKLAALGQRMSDAAGATGPLANGLKDVGGAAETAKNSLTDFYNAQLGIVDSKIAFEQALDDMRDSLKENGTSLDINGQKGRDNMKSIQDAIKDAIRVRDELAAQGKIEEANAAYKRMVDRIREVATQAGLTKKQIEELVKPYEFTITANIVTRGSLPRYVSSNLSEPAQDVARRASGGPVTKGMPYVVGDAGRPEFFVPEQSGYVYPSVPKGGGTTWAAPINYMPSGNAMWDGWFEQFRAQVQSRGGTLAVVGVRG